MNRLVVAVWLSVCVSISDAAMTDNRTALPVDETAKVSGLTADEQCQILVSGTKTEATVALVELTRDTSATLTNLERLIAVIDKASSDLDLPLLTAVNRESSCSGSNRRLATLRRLVVRVAYATDGPERWKGFGRILDYLDSTLLVSSSSKDRKAGLEAMSALVCFRGDVIPCRGVDRLFSTAARLLQDPDPAVKGTALVTLATVGGVCDGYRQKCDDLAHARLQDPQDLAEWQEAIESWAARCRQNHYVHEEDYREAVAHPIDTVILAIDGCRRPGLKFAVEAIVEDRGLMDANYDTLLRYAERTCDETMLSSLARPVLEAAGPEERKRLDSLLDVYERLYSSPQEYLCVYGLRVVLDCHTDASGASRAKANLLPSGPIYRRKRALSLLYRAVRGSRYRMSAAMALGAAAWIDAETARSVLEQLKRCPPLTGEDRELIQRLSKPQGKPEPLEQAIAEAKAAVEYYARNADDAREMP